MEVEDAETNVDAVLVGSTLDDGVVTKLTDGKEEAD